MRLNLQTDYALRVLLYLGADPERIIPVVEIADAYGISRHHLVKVAHRLGQRGYLETLRGRTGGLRLGRPAGAIRIGDVVRHIEPDFELVECFHRSNECVISRECSLKGVLLEAQRAFLAALDRYSLGDMLARPELQTQLLQLRH